MEFFRLPLYIFFGVLPSLVWLAYYLKKDLHPEPKRMIVKVFLWGALAAVPTLFLQLWISESLNQFQYLSALYFPEIYGYLPFIFKIIKWFFVIALTEEIAKYLVVRFIAYKDGALDEPLDIMLYMVVSALGFAALENVLYMFSPLNSPFSFDQIIKITISISFIRFIGATFLHTLSSALVGYFLVLSCKNNQARVRLTLIGLFLATLLHGFYNFSIINFNSPMNFLAPVVIITGLMIFIIYDFDEVKKLKSICKI